MKFTYKRKNKEEWHKWFAWHPVYLEEQKQYIWLDWILRRRLSKVVAWDTEYYYEYKERA